MWNLLYGIVGFRLFHVVRFQRERPARTLRPLTARMDLAPAASGMERGILDWLMGIKTNNKQ